MSQAKMIHVLKAAREENEDILHFSLSGVLPDGQLLAVNKTLRTLSHLTVEHDAPYLYRQVQFTDGEFLMLLPLLENYPYHCPYEMMLASFTYGGIIERHVDECRKRLQAAAEEGVWDAEMRPVRNVLSRTRIKLRAFGIEITSMIEVGYTLLSRNLLKP